MIQNIKTTKIIKMRMMRSIKKIVIYFLIADLFLIVLSLIVDGKIWLINSQVAFLSSLLITLASFKSYEKLVKNRVELAKDNLHDVQDEIDKIDDPHDLYSKDVDFKEVIKEERKKITNLKTAYENFKNSSKGAFSLLRLGAYGFLFVSFLYLVRHELFSIAPYMIGLFVVPLVATFSILAQKGE